VGLDVHLEISRARPGRSLEEALRAAVVDGRLAPGTRLPATRALASDLGLSRTTVAAVFAQLTAEGWLTARVGAGTWVAERQADARPGLVPGVRRPGVRIDLRAGIPDTTGFPRREWLAAVRQVAGSSAADLGYPDPAGVPRLRAALAAYVSRTRGVVVQPGGLVVGHGFGDLLLLACRALRDRGARRVAVEEYGHASHRVLIASAGLEVVALPVDEDGAVVGVLDDVVDAVLLTPAHQFPTGVPLAPDRRRAVVAWAQRTGGTILEDDYDGEFRYDRRAVGALQALDPGRVMYLGTASKALAPAIGLAWAAPPDDLLGDLLAQRELSGGQPSALQQLALAAFLEDHAYDRNVRRLRAVYRARRARLEEVVAAELPGCEVGGLPAGLHGVLRLPAGAGVAAEEAVARAAAARGVLVEGLSALRVGDGLPAGRAPAIVVGYGGATPGQYERALAVLVETVRAVLTGVA